MRYEPMGRCHGGRQENSRAPSSFGEDGRDLRSAEEDDNSRRWETLMLTTVEI
jgi:hypothetical protein